MKKVSYKGVKVLLPENISMRTFKQLVDDCGKDYCMSVQNVIDFISKKYSAFKSKTE